MYCRETESLGVMFDIIGTVGTVTSPNGVPFPFDLWSAKFLNAAHVAQLLETLFCCCCCCTLLFAGSVNGKSLFFSSRLRHTPADGQKIKLKLSPLMIPTAVDPQCVRISDLSRDHALCPRYLFPRSPRPLLLLLPGMCRAVPMRASTKA